jgi:hypothetical protein
MFINLSNLSIYFVQLPYYIYTNRIIMLETRIGLDLGCKTFVRRVKTLLNTKGEMGYLIGFL